MPDAAIFTAEERLPIEPTLLQPFLDLQRETATPDHWNGYWADYAGIAKKYRPRRILEIGVRFGYSAICMLYGVKKNRGRSSLELIGLDNESYVPGSCALASTYISTAVPNVLHQIRQWDTQNGLPPDIGLFGLIHVDGDHSHDGALRDLRLAWGVLQPGGIIIVDDYKFPDIQRAVALFASETTRLKFQAHENLQGHCYLQKQEEKNA